MSNVKFVKDPRLSVTSAEVLAFGHSVLDGKIGEITDAETGLRPEMKLSGNYNDNAIDACTQRAYVSTHIDIFAHSADIVYDIGKEYSIKKAVVTGYYHPLDVNYSLGEFKLYAANDRDTLFDDANEVAHEIGREHWYFGDKNNADWTYDVDGSFRYFGVKILDSNPTDDITRLGYIGLYNDDYTRATEYLLNNFKPNLFSAQEPHKVTDGRIFDTDFAVEIHGTENFDFTVEGYSDITDIWVIGSDGLKVACDGFANVVAERIENERVVYNLNSDTVPVKDGKITVTVTGDGYVEQIGGFGANKKVGIDFDSVICDDFMGVGTNVLPMSFMPESIETGYNEVYWALERERIKKAKPNVVRMWFQPDWLCETYEQYKNGEYNFECQKLQSVYRYLDVFKEIGSEVEFDFGWKVSSHAQEWYSLENVTNKRNSAPKDLDLFAKCCGATLKELVKNRKYDNIKYLTFYNEPDYGNYTENGDFAMPVGVDRRPYWEKMMRKTYAELEKVGLGHIKMWGCEPSGSYQSQLEWLEYMDEHCRDILSCHTHHHYLAPHSRVGGYFKMLKDAAHGTPVMLTECGQNYGNADFTWEMNEVQLFVDVANNGASGALLWCLNSMPITDPCSFTMRNPIDYWDCPQFDGAIDNIRENYYRWAMLSHYVPNHCKSVNTNIVSGSDDSIRVSAFTTGDDYTVVLEINNEVKGDRNIEIALNKHIGKKFYKHVYKMPCLRDGNATLPVACGEIFADDVIRDTVNSDYQEVVYTTIKPVTQVILPQNEVFLKEGQRYALSGTVADGNGDLEFSLAATLGDYVNFDAINATVSFNDKAKAGDMFAIKATAKNNKDAANVVIFKYLG